MLPAPIQFTVVIVDDSVVMRNFLSETLETIGYQVHCFDSPESALQFLEANRPDCIISDYEMPHMSGAEFCKTLRQIESLSGVPILVLSTHDQDDKIIECLNAGADDYLAKRTSAAVVTAKIKLMIEICRAREEKMSQERLRTYRATVGALSHELNNVGATILVALDKVDHAQVESQDKKHFEMFRRNMSRLLTSIKAFRDLNEIEFEGYTDESEIVKFKKSA